MNLITPKNGAISSIIGIKAPTFKVMLGICTHRTVSIEVFGITRLLEACPDPKIKLEMGIGDALIDRSRSKLAKKFLDSDYDILWFLDDDIKVSTMDMTRMMWEMQKYDLDILGAPYALKSETEKCFAVRTLDNVDTVACGKGGEIKEVRYVSTGCMGIRRRVFQKMVEKEIVHLCHKDKEDSFYPFFCPMEYKLGEKWLYLSEDWAFCQRALDLGFKVHCDFGSKLGHIGSYTYDFDDFFRPAKEVHESLVYGVDVQKE